MSSTPQQHAYFFPSHKQRHLPALLCEGSWRLWRVEAATPPPGGPQERPAPQRRSRPAGGATRSRARGRAGAGGPCVVRETSGNSLAEVTALVTPLPVCGWGSRRRCRCPGLPAGRSRPCCAGTAAGERGVGPRAGVAWSHRGRGERAEGGADAWAGPRLLAAALLGPGPERGCRRRGAAMLGAALSRRRHRGFLPSHRELRGGGSARPEWAAGSWGRAGGREGRREGVCVGAALGSARGAQGRRWAVGSPGRAVPDRLCLVLTESREGLGGENPRFYFCLGWFRLQKARSLCSDRAVEPIEQAFYFGFVCSSSNFGMLVN